MFQYCMQYCNNCLQSLMRYYQHCICHHWVSYKIINRWALEKKTFSAICFNSLQTKTIIPGCTKNTALLDAFIAVDIRRISRNFNLYDQKCKPKIRVRVRVMLFNATFNNISVISWRSVLLVDETGVPREDHRPAVRLH